MAPSAPPRVAVVTGAGGGLGRVVAKTLATEGYDVALLDVGGVALEAASEPVRAAGRRAQALSVDVSDRAAVETAVAAARAALGPVHAVVNAAGIAESAPLVPPDDALFDRTFAVNVRGAWVVSTACLPDMLAAKSGRIVNVASTAALRAFKYTAAYVASKHALLGLTRAMSIDLASKGVTVNAVCPGFMDTPMTERTLERIVARTGRTRAQALADVLKEGGQKRLVTPEEVAQAIASLVQGAETGLAIEV
jgi:NAD(P)-dependent dehydrogenase (short-subunit alcohol dehydrogenase family)